MPDPRQHLRDMIASKLYPTYGQEDRGRSLRIADEVLGLFLRVRHGQRDLDVTSLGQSHQQLLRERCLVAEIFLGSERVQGDPLGLYFTDGDEEEAADTRIPGPETGTRE